MPRGCDVVINLETTEEEDIRKLEIAKNRVNWLHKALHPKAGRRIYCCGKTRQRVH